MDPNIAIPNPIARPVGFPPMGQPPMGQPPMGQPPMSQGFNPQMVPPGAMRPPHIAAAPFYNPIENSQKASQFNRGVYVSGFERTLTAAMLQQHFKIKPIAGLRLPLTKHNQNKGFAFIYYNNPDDATYVKEKLDYTAILRNKIRVTKTVIAQNLSKMMFKLRKENIPENQLKDVREKFFNQKSLETEVTSIIGPYFSNFVQVNKIIIPHTKDGKNLPLDYARGFFYISNIKEAINKATLQAKNDTKKEQYDVVLGQIAQKLNTHPVFSKYVKAEIYEYANKNKTNVLHIKNINIKPGEDGGKVAQELRNLIQQHKKQVNIKGCFVSQYDKTFGWANIVFGSYEQIVDVYNYFKNNRVKFRDNVIYANIRNVKDLRTVVVSTVHPDTTEEQMNDFLKKLAEESPRVDSTDQSKGRKYDFASFNIIIQRSFYLDNKHKNIGLSHQQKPEESWRFINTVPRRVVIHFMNQILEKDLRQFVNDIKIKAGWEKIFFEKDRKTTTTATHQKGHIQDGNYIKHADLHKKKNQSQNQQNKQPKPQNKRFMDQQQQQYTFNKNKMGPKMMTQNRTGMPPTNPVRPVQAPIAPTMRPGQIGSMPMMGGMGGMNPKMSQIPVPNTGMPIPPMGMSKPPGSIPQMGIPPMGMPSMGLPPMGMPTIPQMGMPPPMGVMGPPKMGVPPLMQPPQNMEKKQ